MFKTHKKVVANLVLSTLVMEDTEIGRAEWSLSNTFTEVSPGWMLKLMMTPSLNTIEYKRQFLRRNMFQTKYKNDDGKVSI